MIQVGDLVSVLDEPLTGTVISISSANLVLETEDGFEMTFAIKEVVKIESDIEIMPSYDEVERNIKEKNVFVKKEKRPIKVRKTKEQPPMEIDLHIDKLIKSTRGMTNHDIVTMQLETAERQLRFAIEKRIQKVVFIHGVGQGVLKEELRYVFGKYDNVKISEADYKRYGVGAMEIYILQNPR